MARKKRRRSGGKKKVTARQKSARRRNIAVARKAKRKSSKFGESSTDKHFAPQLKSLYKGMKGKKGGIKDIAFQDAVRSMRHQGGKASLKRFLVSKGHKNYAKAVDRVARWQRKNF